jgi:hypothetical protein
MQFGRISALVVLGMILLGIQAMLVVRKTPTSVPSETAPKTVESKTSLIPEIVGAICLIGGVATFATARRADEPPPKDAVP